MANNVKILRVAYLDYLRLLATIGVVIIHVSLSFTHFNNGALDTRWQIVNITESLVRWSVPIFVMISGVSFLCLKQELTIKELWRKYILRLFLALVCWNSFYFLCSYGAAYVKGVELPELSRMLVPYGHLWFLPMMIGVYLVMPFLRAINDRTRGGYFLLLWAVYLTMTFLFGNELFQPFMFTMCVGYPGYFLLGGYLHLLKKTDEVKPIALVAVFAVCVTLIAVLTRYCTGGDEARTKYYEYVSPLVAISSVAVFMMVKTISVNSRLGIVLDWILRYTRDDLFGIFLIHIFWIDIIPHIRIVDFLIHSNVYFGIPIMTVTIFILSLLSTKLLRLIPLINKLV